MRWGVTFERQVSTDLDADSWGTEILVTATTNATSGITTSTSFSFTNAQADGVGQAEPYRLRVRRIGGDAADTMTGDAELLTVHVRK